MNRCFGLSRVFFGMALPRAFQPAMVLPQAMFKQFQHIISIGQARVSSVQSGFSRVFESLKQATIEDAVLAIKTMQRKKAKVKREKLR